MQMRLEPRTYARYLICLGVMINIAFLVHLFTQGLGSIWLSTVMGLLP